MTTKKTRAPAAAPATEQVSPEAKAPRETRSQTLVALMRVEAGATAADLGAAIGWQVHSIRGFIAGTLKKRTDITVVAERKDGATRYRVVDRAEVSA
ncbi:DUF3489 domain-containing protein [Phenylobacterium sp.]|jgi:hypothetical protein|uniref:DUF3489 domain-containing protein n=1 Tax=Phenylobacterium sp. TaxID=1871053 RepID=UPI002E3325EC|nr:DUF3489 domain-containing protein [Phenylobacterium sp.]HEX3365790.1 DUF3489 domain-containing protein [Phenylobacterium sp.]